VPERGGREGAGWTTGWKMADVMFWGGRGRGGNGANGVGFGGVVIVKETREAEDKRIASELPGSNLEMSSKKQITRPIHV
jgi:hypothetical protein